MGYGTWTATSWKSYTTTRGFTDTSSVSEMYTSYTVKDEFDPKNITMREARDSADHPNSTPIILALDVTGSMGSVLETVSKRLGDTMAEIYKRNPVEDPQVCFMALGDAECDRYPLQVTQFESDIRIAEQLNDIYFERGGGGNGGESYMLPWYFASRKCVTDAWEKRGKKGFLFTVGDECCLPNLTKEAVKEFIGDDVEGDLKSTELLTEVSRKYEVYHIIVDPVCYQEPEKNWKKLLGKNCIVVEDIAKIPEVIVSILEINAGKTADEVINTWDGTTKLVVGNAIRALRTPIGVTTGGLIEF